MAQVGFAKMINIGGTSKFLPHIMEIFAFFMLTGFIVSILFTPETKGLTLEELSQEDQTHFVKDSNIGHDGAFKGSDASA